MNEILVDDTAAACGTDGAAAGDEAAGTGDAMSGEATRGPNTSAFLRWRKVERGSMETLSKRWSEQLLRFGRLLGLNENDAQDVVQRTLLKALSLPEGWEARTTLRGWLYAVARNDARETQRASRRDRVSGPCGQECCQEADAGGTLAARPATVAARRPVTGKDGRSYDGTTRQPLSSEAGPPTRALRRERESKMGRALEELPESFRLAVQLIEREGFSSREAAEALGVPARTVLHRKDEAKRLLRVRLRELGETS